MYLTFCVIAALSISWSGAPRLMWCCLWKYCTSSDSTSVGWCDSWQTRNWMWDEYETIKLKYLSVNVHFRISFPYRINCFTGKTKFKWITQCMEFILLRLWGIKILGFRTCKCSGCVQWRSHVDLFLCGSKQPKRMLRIRCKVFLNVPNIEVVGHIWPLLHVNLSMWKCATKQPLMEMLFERAFKAFYVSLVTSKL